MTGSIQIKKGILYLVLNLRDLEGKRRPKWISTGLKEKGNKKKAEALLQKAISDYEMGTISFDVAEECDVKKAVANQDTLLCEKETGTLFWEWLEYWLNCYRYEVRENTYESYCVQMQGKQGAIPYFKEHPIFLQNLTARDLKQFYNYKLEKCSPKTVKKYKHNIQKSLELALRENVISRNPNNDVNISSSSEVAFNHSYYESDQIASLLNNIKGDIIETAIILASTYGLRRSEALGLTWDNVDFLKNQIKIFKTAVKTKSGTLYQDRTKNKTSRRVLPLSMEVKNHLLMQFNHQQEMKNFFGKSYLQNDLVCKRDDGTPLMPNYITKHFKDILIKNSMPIIRFHDLRHSAATFLLESGFTMKEVSEWLGHCDINTTMNIYAHVSEKNKEKMAEKLGSVIATEKSVRTPLELIAN